MALVPKNPANERVYTPDPLARAVVYHFKPKGQVLEPCAGRGAFVRALRAYDKDPATPRLLDVRWAELDRGRDFLTGDRWTRPGRWQPSDPYRFAWIITNPPWGPKFLKFLIRAMDCADNIVFLSLVPNYFQRSKRKAMKAAGFAVRKIVYVENVPPKPWPQTGFELAAVWLQHGWRGPITEENLTNYETTKAKRPSIGRGNPPVSRKPSRPGRGNALQKRRG